jgi:predicted component of type VI protein secretion system
LRFRSEPIYALQDRGRNLWLLDPSQRLSIGRSTRNDVVVKENAWAVSRQHAFIAGTKQAGAFYLTDTSAYGTLINGVLCKKASALVRVGDLIHLGRVAGGG